MLSLLELCSARFRSNLPRGKVTAMQILSVSEDVLRGVCGDAAACHSIAVLLFHGMRPEDQRANIEHPKIEQMLHFLPDVFSGVCGLTVEKFSAPNRIYRVMRTVTRLEICNMPSKDYGETWARLALLFPNVEHFTYGAGNDTFPFVFLKHENSLPCLRFLHLRISGFSNAFIPCTTQRALTGLRIEGRKHASQGRSVMLIDRFLNYVSPKTIRYLRLGFPFAIAETEWLGQLDNLRHIHVESMHPLFVRNLLRDGGRLGLETLIVHPPKNHERPFYDALLRQEQSTLRTIFVWHAETWTQLDDFPVLRRCRGWCSTNALCRLPKNIRRAHIELDFPFPVLSTSGLRRLKIDWEQKRTHQVCAWTKTTFAANPPLLSVALCTKGKVDIFLARDCPDNAAWIKKKRTRSESLTLVIKQ